MQKIQGVATDAAPNEARMVYDCWRRLVGIIKPTKGSGSPVELIEMLPDGIGVIPLFNNVRHGKIEEFQSAIPAYEEKIAELA